MSTYYRYEFVSPQPLYAEVKEEMRSYFASGAIDDVMFPIWTNQCLQKLGKGSFQIIPTALEIKNYKSRLPDDFESVREAWMCRPYERTYPLAGAEYTLINKNYKLDGEKTCNVCTTCGEEPIIQEIYKSTQDISFEWTIDYLLTPTIINEINCPKNLYCANLNSVAPNSYDVKNNQFLTTFKEGKVYLLYYSNQVDCDQNTLVPKNYRIAEFIKAFIKQKLYEQLFNQSTAETFNQTKYKFDFYKSESDQAYILADIETKKETIYKSHRAARRVKNRFNKYEIR